MSECLDKAGEYGYRATWYAVGIGDGGDFECRVDGVADYASPMENRGGLWRDDQ